MEDNSKIVEELNCMKRRAEVAERALLIAARQLEIERGYPIWDVTYLAKEIYIPEVLAKAAAELDEYPELCKSCNYFYENQASEGKEVCNVSEEDGKVYKDCKILRESLENEGSISTQ